MRGEVPASPSFQLEFALNTADAPTIAGYLRRGDDGRRGVEAVVTPLPFYDPGNARQEV